MDYAFQRPLPGAGFSAEPFSTSSRQAPRNNSAAFLVLDTVGPILTSNAQNTQFKTAIRLYEEGHWPFAFDHLSALADEHHPAASKLALLMLRYGRALYGTSFEARPGQVAQWAQCVLRATSRATASPNSMTASA